MSITHPIHFAIDFFRLFYCVVHHNCRAARSAASGRGLAAWQVRSGGGRGFQPVAEPQLQLGEGDGDAGGVEFFLHAFDEAVAAGEELFGGDPDADGPVDGVGAEALEEDIDGFGGVAFGDALTRPAEGGADDLEVAGVGDADGDIGPAPGVVGDVFDGLAEDLAVGDDESAVVGGVDLGVEEVEVVDAAELAGDVDDVADFERAEEHEHDAGGEVAQRALHGQADGEAGGADEGCDGGDVEAEKPQAGDDAHDEDDPADDVAEEAAEGLVDLGFFEDFADGPSDVEAQQPGADEQAEDADELAAPLDGHAGEELGELGGEEVGVGRGRGGGRGVGGHGRRDFTLRWGEVWGRSRWAGLGRVGEFGAECGADAGGGGSGEQQQTDEHEVEGEGQAELDSGAERGEHEGAEAAAGAGRGGKQFEGEDAHEGGKHEQCGRADERWERAGDEEEAEGDFEARPDRPEGRPEGDEGGIDGWGGWGPDPFGDSGEDEGATDDPPGDCESGGWGGHGCTAGRAWVPSMKR